MRILTVNIFNNQSTTADGCDAPAWVVLRTQQHLAIRTGVYAIWYRA